MDIPRPDNFNETYLYEGLIMDMDKIVTEKLTWLRADGMRPSSHYKIWSASHGCTFPIIHLSDLVRVEVYTLCQCSPSRSEAGKLIGEC